MPVPSMTVLRKLNPTCLMRLNGTKLPPNPFEQDGDPEEIMRKLLKKTRPLSHEEAMRRIKEAIEIQRKAKARSKKR